MESRIYADQDRSFHPKSYIFHYAGDLHEIFIGSSNISKSALTSGIEWNYRFTNLTDEAGFRKFYSVFEELFNNHSVIADEHRLKQYSKSWRRPEALGNAGIYDNSQVSGEGGFSGTDFFQSGYENAGAKESAVNSSIPAAELLPFYKPVGAQIEALYALNNARLDGIVKCLVVAATGVGKTALAAFDSLAYKKILFVAHRQEILEQARKTFASIRRTRSIGYFNAAEKISDREVTLGSVSTLGSGRYLSSTYFAPDYFDYIVMDEIHHGVASQYRRIMNYFHPEFMLGLTATPERLDQKSVFELFDYNVPYEINLSEAINKGYLVPFFYHGIFDEYTDYSGIRIINGRYNQSDLTKIYRGNLKRQELIIRHYLKYRSCGALGFCCSREHAEEMSEFFSERKISAVAVYSGTAGKYSVDRDTAVQRLKDGKIDVIFSVDMFNEGVDIPSVDLVMFLRPTESPVIFLQQLGRGLRRHKGKQKLTVLDFIGNYRNADRISRLFGSCISGIDSQEAGIGQGMTALNTSVHLPESCNIDLDVRLIDLFARMEMKRQKIEARIEMEYHRIREILGRRPMRHDLFIHMEDSIYRLIMEHSKHNIFKNYLAFLERMNELDENELKLCSTLGREFIRTLETTSMTKVYKMPVLQAFIDTGDEGNICSDASPLQNEKIFTETEESLCEEGLDDPVLSVNDVSCREQANYTNIAQSHAALRLKATKENLLDSWKKFFSQAGNWQDLEPDMNLDKFKKLPDSYHLKKIYSMPVRVLSVNSGFFRLESDGTLVLSEELSLIASNPALINHVLDVIFYRTADYYKRRYETKSSL
jgi:superfamily II DNA or RNA helicase